MTAATLPAPDLGTARVTAKGLLLSEWTKLRSVRSLLLTLALSFAFVAGLSAYLLVEGQTLGDSAAAADPVQLHRRLPARGAGPGRPGRARGDR